MGEVPDWWTVYTRLKLVAQELGCNVAEAWSAHPRLRHMALVTAAARADAAAHRGGWQGASA